jgi:hypothetical protein
MSNQLSNYNKLSARIFTNAKNVPIGETNPGDAGERGPPSGSLIYMHCSMFLRLLDCI